MTRKITQIAFDPNLHALCDDGSVWVRDTASGWSRIEDIPQDAEPEPAPQPKQFRWPPIDGYPIHAIAKSEDHALPLVSFDDALQCARAGHTLVEAVGPVTALQIYRGRDENEWVEPCEVTMDGASVTYLSDTMPF